MNPVNKIERFMKKHKLTQGEFAKMVGFKQCTISMWKRGVKRIGPHAAIAIERKTGGEITRAELRPDLWAA